MDWFTWLSKTDLDPSLAYEYALTFTHNELNEEDIAYFSHDFLQSMGISIDPVVWFMFAFNQTKNYVVKQIRALKHNESSSLSVVPKRNHSLRWKVAMLQRNKRLRPMLGNDCPRFVSEPGILMLTNGSPPVEGSRSSGSTRSSVWVESEANAESGHFTTMDEAAANPWNSSFSRTTNLSPDREYWSSSTEEIKWDSMFKNLKPT